MVNNAAEEILLEFSSEQGWNSDSVIIHLTGFIEERKLLTELREYLQAVADEENADSGEG